jgi:hypothetical protein
MSLCSASHFFSQSIILLGDVMQNVDLLSIAFLFMLTVVMLNVFMLNVILRSAIMLNVILLSVMMLIVTFFICAEYHSADSRSAECQYFLFVMISVVLLNVLLLSAIILIVAAPSKKLSTQGELWRHGGGPGGRGGGGERRFLLDGKKGSESCDTNWSISFFSKKVFVWAGVKKVLKNILQLFLA